jgi:predicted NAD/FAD-binding protein
MPREWDTPVRESWNVPIHQIIKAIDNHTRLYLETGNPWHRECADGLREYLHKLKTYIQSQEAQENQG